LKAGRLHLALVHGTISDSLPNFSKKRLIFASAFMIQALPGNLFQINRQKLCFSGNTGTQLKIPSRKPMSNSSNIFLSP
jgi:hypothetical protein